MVLLVGACESPPIGPEAPGLTILEMPGPDTIEAIMTTPLVVQAADANGRLLRHADIFFVAPSVPLPGSAVWGVEMQVAPADGPRAGVFAEGLRLRTDGSGRATVQIRLGPLAPSGRLFVIVDDTIAATPPMLRDTIDFAIRPGNAADALMATHDTSVFVDGTLLLRGGNVDRRGNLRTDPVAFEAGPTLSVSVDGAVTPSTFARSWVVVRSAHGEDTAYVSVVPRGRILTSGAYEGGGPLYTVGLDGSAYREIPTLHVWWEATPQWAADGKHFVYSTFQSNRVDGGEIFIGDTLGATRLVVGGAHFLRTAYPRWSPDFEWIYFSAMVAEGALWNLWRVRPDGTGLEPLTFDPGPAGSAWRADPSFDGERLVFNNGGTLRTVDLATLELDEWSDVGTMARWSPDGTRVAFLSEGGLWVASPSTGQRRRVTPAEETMYGWQIYMRTFDWSPDGKWLIARNPQYRLELIHVETMLRLPLNWSYVMSQPSWLR